MVGIGEAHGSLDDVGVEIGDACGTEEGEVVPYGIVPTAIRSDLADEGIAQFVGPVVNVIPPPVGDDMGIATDVCLRVVVDDLGSTNFARIQSHFEPCGVPDRTGGLALKPGGGQECGGGQGGQRDKCENADQGKAGGVDPKFFLGKSFHGSFNHWDNRF